MRAATLPRCVLTHRDHAVEGGFSCVWGGRRALMRWLGEDQPVDIIAAAFVTVARKRSITSGNGIRQLGAEKTHQLFTNDFERA